MYYYIEVIVIIAVIIYQITHSIRLYKKLIVFKSIFDFPLKVKYGYITRENLTKPIKSLKDVVFYKQNTESSEHPINDNNIIRIALIVTAGKNEEITNIKNSINSYLLNNYGAAVNFSIIKDIIDREVDGEDEEISHAISTPLYLGLAAAMFGIIFGLLAMPELSGTDFLKDIKPLLQGVKIALFASLTGLFCTTVLSSFIYSDAKKKILKKKNSQISYLQAKLLPELIKAEDTGVSGLKASLDRFAREATKISDNVLFAANQTGENISLQHEVLDRVERINVTKVSKTNLELFDRLENNMDSFNRFTEYVSSMMKISENLKDFANRTTSIDKIAEQIDNSLKESSRLMSFITEHFEKIETSGNAALKAVDLSEAHFKEAIERLREATDNRIASLNNQANIHESKLTEIYNEIGRKLEKITADHLIKLQEAYKNSIPQFNQLNNLALIPEFQKLLSNNATQLRNDLGSNTDKYIESIYKLNDSFTSIKDHIDNSAILTKLNSIEILLQKRNNHKPISMVDSKPANSVKPKKGFINRMKNFFSKVKK